MYKEVLRTTAGHAMVKGLQPGQSYRLRVQALNADGLPGPYSAPVLVHTLLETPQPPQPVVGKGAVGARAITLCWKARNFVTNTRTEVWFHAASYVVCLN